MAADSAPVGVFDSGIGGLTVLREVLRQHPAERCLYLADSRLAPYGTKTEDVLRERCERVTGFLLEQGAKAVVVACNTASVAALPHLRARYPIPFVGIVPAVKPAAAMSRTGIIGVLATSTTIGSQPLARLIETHASGVRVVTRMCPGLVDVVERGLLEGPEVDDALAQEAQPLLDQGIDVLVLGCTHLPFLRAALERLCGPRVQLVDPSEAVARQLGRVLAEGGLESGAPGASPVYFATGEPAVFRAHLLRLMGPLAGEVEAVEC